MANPGDGWNPFAFTDIWERSFLDGESRENDVSMIRPVQLDLLSILLDNPYAPSKPLELELQLPALESLEFGQLENLAPSDSSVTSTDDVLEPIPSPSVHRDKEVPDDIWHFDYDIDAIEIAPQLNNWEEFYELVKQDHDVAYLSEAGPAVFDAALAAAAKKTGSRTSLAQPIRTDAILSSLWQLGLGRSSVLYMYDANARKFIPLVPNGCMTGLSLTSSTGVLEEFLQGGNDTLILRDFVAKTYSANACPSKIALANVISTILAVIESHIISDATCKISLLNMQHCFRRPHKITRFLVGVIQCVARSVTNVQVISNVSRIAANLDGVDGWKKMIAAVIVKRVASPWLESLSALLLLNQVSSTQGTNPEAVSEFSDRQSFEDALDLAFLPETHKLSIKESLKGIQYLRDHAPDHPILHPGAHDTEPQSLELAFTWQDAERISGQVKAYESRLYNAVNGITTVAASGAHDHASEQPSTVGFEPDVFGLDEADIHANVERTRMTFDSPPTETMAYGGTEASVSVPTKEALQKSTNNMENLGIDLNPPISTVFNFSLQPILEVQARFVNTCCLRALFHQHELRKHLSLHYAFHLLGSGTFVSRLSMSLFDPDLVTTERELGVMRSATAMGLRVGSTTRKNWPPASSELRLALMGVLREGWQNERQHDTQKYTRNSPLPGNMSFGIRELAENEIENCLDVDSIYALDFLRLQYEAPGALSNIITKPSLDKYDRAFRFFLKLMRMTFITNIMWRRATLQARDQRQGRVELRGGSTAQRFRTEATHFVSTLCSHFFTNAVGTPWRRFQRHLDDIERDLRDFECHTPMVSSLDGLERLHSEMLDGILSGLLLRHHQQAAATLLEDIFNEVLKFSRMDDSVQAKSNERRLHDDAELKTSYEVFQSKTLEFIASCRQLGGRADHGARSRTQAKDDGSRSALEIVELLRVGGHYTQAA